MHDVSRKRWPRQSHDPNLSKPSCDSRRPEGGLARNFKKHQATLGRSLENLTHQNAREPDVFQHIAIDNQIGLAPSRLIRCSHTDCCRHS